MDCCSHEGRPAGDARFEIKKVADGVYAAVAAPAYKVNSNTAIIESDDGVVIVDTQASAADDRLRADDEALPARSRDPPPLPRPGAHRGGRVRLPAEGEGRHHGRRRHRLDTLHG